MVVAQVQKPAPHFTSVGIVNGEIQEDISLSDYLGRYLVFFWYPLDFTFVCPTEIIAFNDALEDFRALNCEVLAASCDSEYAHHNWINTPRNRGGLGKKTRLTIISDKTRRIAKDYGVYVNELGVCLRGLFIIDPKGIVRQITINDLPVGRSIEETIRLVTAFQYTDKNGEVCPANWKSGDEAIKPNPKDVKKYFADDD
ncbi:Peroxiredoxin-4 [Mucor flavus]|uniref:Peroxiredoxin-4 n=1 Tax=Mucor flavus TaxID=439312 RepID=A0ABP9YJK9_9FUNG